MTQVTGREIAQSSNVHALTWTEGLGLEYCGWGPGHRNITFTTEGIFRSLKNISNIPVHQVIRCP